MKGVMVFDLPEDSEDYDLYYHARDYYCALWDIYTELRQEWKYGEHDVVKLDRVWDKFHEILDENGVEMP